MITLSFYIAILIKIRRDIVSWANIVELTGKRLVLAYDEPGRADGGATVDADYPDALLPSKREVSIPSEKFLRDGLWSALTAGANGVEAYYGYKTGCSDLDCQDHRTRAQLWEGGRHALNFFNTYVGERALKMRASDLTTVGNDDYVFADPGEYYVIIPGQEEVQLRLPGVQGKFMVDWYDRAKGGPLQTGSKPFVLGGASSITKKNRRRQGPSSVELGTPPETGSGQWTILVRRAESNDIRVEAESYVSQRNIDERQWCRSDDCPSEWQDVSEDETDYAAIIPDTRLTHDDKLIRGENFTNKAGQVDHCGVIGGIWIDVPSAGRHTVEFSMREDGFIMDAFHLTLSSEMPDVLREENETSAQMKINKIK